MKSIAATVAANKAIHPELYCRTPGCLWRIVVRGQPSPCQRHPLPQAAPAVSTTETDEEC